MKVCVSLPVKDVSSVKNHVEYAIREGADYIELRFDYADTHTDTSDIIDALYHYHYYHKDRMIFTCRRSDEGGMYRGSEYERLSIIKRLASLKPMLVDLEYKTILENRGFYDQLVALNTSILVSYHDFESTPRVDDMLTLVREMRSYSSRVKLVTRAESIEDNDKIVELYRCINDSGMKIELIAFCMGEYGTVSRVICALLGSPFTYASLVESVAPGQLTLREMRGIYAAIPANYSYTEDRSRLLRLISDVRRVR